MRNLKVPEVRHQEAPRSRLLLWPYANVLSSPSSADTIGKSPRRHVGDSVTVWKGH